MLYTIKFQEPAKLAKGVGVISLREEIQRRREQKKKTLSN